MTAIFNETRNCQNAMAHVSHKLKNAVEGALAGGGDPATSPLYVFGPFLKLIVVAGVAQVTFGASVWMVILTISVVSAMYRLVMRWVIDGSGGSGLSEEEFGGWAVKVNAAITFIEYTLTFLVSMSAMVTFIADRIPFLNEQFLWMQYRTLLAIALSILTGWLVNRGPKVATRAFGPATAGVLLLLWAMVFATTWKLGFHLPDLNFQAFQPGFFEFTLNGYARILAVMTGIEVFANLVAAYDGDAAQKSRKAFNSLLIIMGTTGVTMVIVGPAIFQLSDPTDPYVSVFTQTMDRLLPDPLPYLGTIVGIAVLMSASAASAQGLQNLALGLHERNYIPRYMGERNEFEVADKPVWLEVAIVAFCFTFFGTHEETYLAIYAAGVFILLSMTGWAVTKRLIRQLREKFEVGTIFLIGGTIVAALLTSGSTLIIFEERFLEGAWTYFIFIPILYAMFTYFRRHMGRPSAEMEYLGMLDAAQLAGFGFGQYDTSEVPLENGERTTEVTWQPDPKELSTWRDEKVTIKNLVVLLDGSTHAAQALPVAKMLCRKTGATLHLLSAVKNDTQEHKEQFEETTQARKTYLQNLSTTLVSEGYDVITTVQPGYITDATAAYLKETNIDLVVLSTRGKSGEKHWEKGGASRKLVRNIAKPILMVQAERVQHDIHWVPRLKRIMVALDGSISSERTLPYARTLAKAFKSEIFLVSVPAIPSASDYRAPAEYLESLRNKKDTNMRKFLSAVARGLRKEGLKVNTIVTGSLPAKTLVRVAAAKHVDMIMMTSKGRGGLKLLFMGSVAEQVVQDSDQMVFMIPIPDLIDD
jgi:nucleotide-binding universal stress UspA family protein